MSYYTRCSHASAHQTNQTIHQNGDEDGEVVAQSIIPFDMLVLNAAGYYGHTELRQWQMEYCDQEATLKHPFGPQPQTPDFQHPVQELSDMLQNSCHIGPQPPPSDPTYPTYSDETPVSTLRYLLENPTPWQGLVPRACDVDVGFSRFSNWPQTHLNHVDRIDQQFQDLSITTHDQRSIGPQAQTPVPEASPTCLDNWGSVFTPYEIGLFEGTTPAQVPSLLASDDVGLNGCMPWSQPHPNHVDRIDPQFDENPWGSQQIAHHSTANYAPAPLRPPGPLPVQQPTRVVAGIKHCTVIEQTSYQVRGQRRRSGQPLLRVDFYRSNGRPGIGLSQPKDLRDDKAEVSFVGGKGQKMSYRIRFPGGHNPIDEQKNVTLRGGAQDGPRRVLTHKKMVKQVIEVIERFIEISSNVVLPEEGKQWKFGGDDGITLENLVLLSVEQVSVGSLQPSLMYVDPSQPW